ncbi:hypothetical protein ACGFX4_06795 [Kitasatospora sp. NPDC048365]|uniref:hypothetical protein n=1 Tax=Kitasatospora sp. NPDC048365 TaxID=3364050 RepID=UPI003711F5DA
MSVSDVPSPWAPRPCAYCGAVYQPGGRGNGGWFHFRVVAVERRNDGRARISGHWRAGDWTDGMPLVLATRNGPRTTVLGATMEPPRNNACEAGGQRTLLVPDLGPLEPTNCIHAAR